MFTYNSILSKIHAIKPMHFSFFCEFVRINISFVRINSLRWESPSSSNPLTILETYYIFPDYFSKDYVDSQSSQQRLTVSLSSPRLLGVVCSVIADSLWPHGLQFTRLLCPWNFSDKNAGVGYHFLLQGIFPTQGSSLVSPVLTGMLFTMSTTIRCYIKKN